MCGDLARVWERGGTVHVGLAQGWGAPACRPNPPSPGLLPHRQVVGKLQDAASSFLPVKSADTGPKPQATPRRDARMEHVPQGGVGVGVANAAGTEQGRRWHLMPGQQAACAQ